MADALSTVLSQVDLDGAILSRAEFGAPWGVASEGLPVSIMHAVVEGCAYLRCGSLHRRFYRLSFTKWR